MATKIVNGVSVPLTPEEEAAATARAQAWADGATLREAKRAFRQQVSDARSFDQEERDILIAAYNEVQLYRSDNTINTPIIDAIKAVFPGQNKVQIGITIENRVQNYLVSSATALANKIKGGG